MVDLDLLRASPIAAFHVSPGNDQDIFLPPPPRPAHVANLVASQSVQNEEFQKKMAIGGSPGVTSTTFALNRNKSSGSISILLSPHPRAVSGRWALMLLLPMLL